MPANKDTYQIGAAIKYNPHLWGPEELRAIFVARKKELRQVLDIITQTEISTAPQHTLIIGQRGMGKSTLLQRVALAVEEDEGLSKAWLPLRFPEEQYTVNTLAELWGNVLGALADALENKPQEQIKIDNFLEELEQLSKDKREKKAVDFLQTWCDENQQRLLLLMDSSDLLLANLSHSGKKKKTDAGAPQLWRLRDTLQNYSCFFWLGGSYQSLDADALYHDTFLDFFYNIDLKPLTLKETKNCMHELAKIFGIGRGLKGKSAVKELDRIFTEHPARLKTLHRLSGGNLRTTTILYELYSAGGNNDVRVDLKRLLDLMTPLYKSRIEALAEQQRKILAHLFEHWSPISLGDLAEASGIEKTSLSPQLQRLELEGLIEKTEIPGTTRKAYQVTERFFNIWYLMRNAQRRLRLRLSYLISFMRLWFNTEELTELAQLQNNKHKDGTLKHLNDIEYSRVIALALPENSNVKQELEWNIFRHAQRDFKDKLGDLFDLTGEDMPYATSVDYLARLEVVEKKLKQLPLNVSKKALEAWVDNILSSSSMDLNEKEALADTKTDQIQFDSLNEAFTNESKKLSSATSQGSYRLIKKSIRSGDFFPDCPESDLALKQLVNCFSGDMLAFSLALDLFVKKHMDNNVEKAYKYLLQNDPRNADKWNGLGELYQIHLNRYDDAEKAYKKAIEFDADNAYLFNNLGDLYRNDLNRYGDAETAYKKAIELDADNAYSFNQLGVLYQYDLKRYDESEKAYEKSIKLDSGFASPLSNLGNLYQYELMRYEESEKKYKQAIKLDADNSNLLTNLGNLYRDYLERYDDAEKTYKKAIEIDADYMFPWFNLGDLYQDYLERYDDSEKAYKRAIELDSNFEYFWFKLGNLYHYHLERYGDAENAYKKAIELDADYEMSWANLGDLYQYNLRSYDEAEKAYKKVIEIDADKPSNWANLGNLYQHRLKRYVKAEKAYLKAIELDANYAYPWNGLGDLYKNYLKRYDEADKAYQQAIKLDQENVDFWISLGNLYLDQCKKPDKAERAFRNAIKYDEKNSYAYVNLARLLANLSDKEEKNSSEIAILYRKAIDNAGEHHHLLLQANLYLGNKDLSMQALEKLAKGAEQDDALMFFRIKEQCAECFSIGLGSQLLELMQSSRYAQFLLPFTIALQSLEGDNSGMLSAPMEVAEMAEEMITYVKELNDT